MRACRKQNEDRFQLEVAEGAVDEGIPEIYAGAAVAAGPLS